MLIVLSLTMTMTISLLVMVLLAPVSRLGAAGAREAGRACGARGT